MWPQNRLRQPVARDGVWRENSIGARPLQFRLGFFFTGARGHVELAVQVLGGKNDEQVVGVGGQGGNEPACAVDTYRVQGLVTRGIGGHCQKSREHGFFNPLRL